METNQELPVTFVIFGASGDLTRRKLMPSLFSLFLKKRLPEKFTVMGFSNVEWDDAGFRAAMRQAVDEFTEDPFKGDAWSEFAPHLFYMTGDFTKNEDYQQLASRLAQLEAGPVGRMYYLATPPQFFPTIALGLSQVKMFNQEAGWRRLVIEKPFGVDYQSARQLNETLHRALEEEQIFRIDHYLGKETVQNLLIFRFANILFEPVWNREYIDSVQISVLEEVGIGHRAGYYEQAGVLRDMFQNHLLQLLMLTALEPPKTFHSKDLQERKLDVLKAIRPITGEEIAKNTVRGQYSGYREAEGVAPDSQTATYAALRLYIDNNRWKGVPFFLRSGKSIDRKCTEIVIKFNCPPYAVFPLPPAEEITPNLLAMCIQPDEGIFLRFEAKVPDTESDMRSVEMEFHYSESFGKAAIPEAYERLMLEIIQGDHTLFNQDELTERSWKLFDPILQHWQRESTPTLQIYEPNSWGPAAADALIAEAGWEWLVTCGIH